jgi:hypothetical protein
MTHIIIEQAELEQVLVALKRCYDVTDYPANGNTLQDEAIAVLEQALAPTHPPQRTEQNFCSRCGKRTKDLITIHTCTPPKD